MTEKLKKIILENMLKNYGANRIEIYSNPTIDAPLIHKKWETIELGSITGIKYHKPALIALTVEIPSKEYQACKSVSISDCAKELAKYDCGLCWAELQNHYHEILKLIKGNYPNNKELINELKIAYVSTLVAG